MSHNGRYGVLRDARSFCFGDKPPAERVKIDQAAALSGRLVIHAKLLPVGGETLTEDITCISFISQFVEEPILRVFALLGLPQTVEPVDHVGGTRCLDRPSQKPHKCGTFSATPPSSNLSSSTIFPTISNTYVTTCTARVRHVMYARAAQLPANGKPRPLRSAVSISEYSVAARAGRNRP